MGKIATYCQISGCSPEIQFMLEFYHRPDYLSEEEKKSLSGPDGSSHRRVMEVIKLLLDTQDEREGIQAMSVIGPFDANNKHLWGPEEHPTNLDEILAGAEGLVQEFPGCRMGNLNMFDLGQCEGPNGDADGSQICFGPYFFVLTNMLAILEGATGGRVSVQRLWRLSMMKDHYELHTDFVIPGVDYGPVCDHQDQWPWLFGDIDPRELPKLGRIGTTEDIAEVIRKRGFWMWMRPDRFPIGQVIAPCQDTNVVKWHLEEHVSHTPISKLPSEIVQAIAHNLNIRDIIALATANQLLYYHLLGNRGNRDSLARAYIHKSARWCLPSGEAELRWWNERRGDDALGWDYLRRCWSENHSMRNRRRIWRAAESIEEECERIGA